MKKKNLIIGLTVAALLIACIVTLALIPNNPVSDLLGIIGSEKCVHNYTSYTLSGIPTYDTPASVQSTCTRCQEIRTQSVTAATGLLYETDDEGNVRIVSADNVKGSILYISSKQPNGASVDIIGESVFFENNFEAIFIEEGIRAMEDNAFSHSTTLKEIHLPGSIETYGSYTFAGCTNLTTAVLAPNTTKLGMNQFYECSSLTTINLPDGIQDLPLGLFFGCTALTEIQLPNSLVNVGAEAFASCPQLKSIEFPETLKEIYPNSFAGCTSLKTLSIPALDTLHFNAFLGCTGLKTVFLSGGIKTIEVNGSDGPFYCCSSDLTLYTDAQEKPSGWSDHFENYSSDVADEDGGELNEDAYQNLKVVYGCSLSDFPG